MWTHRRLILIFYRPLLIANLAFSAIALFFLHVWGWHFILNTLFIKAFGYAVLAGYQSILYKNVYFYYRNAGVSIRKMYGYTFGYDFLLFILFVIIYFLLK